MRQPILTILFSLMFFGSHAQFYFKAGGGYSFPMPASLLGQNTASIDVSNTDPETGYFVPVSIIDKAQQVRGTLNSGAVSAVTFGYVFPSRIGLEITAGYVFGKEYSFSDEQAEYRDVERLNFRFSRKTMKAKNPFLAPAITFTTGETVLRPYASVGIVVALPTMIETQERRSDYDNDFGTTTHTYKYSRGLAIGMRGGAGLDVRLGEKISAFVDVTLTALTYNPRQREITRYEVNDQDYLPTLSVRARVTELVDDFSIDYLNHDGTSEQPWKEVGPSLAFSALASTAGLRFQL